jgi:hypothetical protein
VTAGGKWQDSDSRSCHKISIPQLKYAAHLTRKIHCVSYDDQSHTIFAIQLNE